MANHYKNKNINAKNSIIPDSTFPIIPFIHMTYAHISTEGNTIHMDLEYENGKKRKFSIY